MRYAYKRCFAALLVLILAVSALLGACSRNVAGDIDQTARYFDNAGSFTLWWDALALYDAGRDLDNYDIQSVIPSNVQTADYAGMAKYLLLKAVCEKSGASVIWDPVVEQQYLVELETVLVDSTALTGIPLNQVAYAAMAVLAGSKPGDFDTTAVRLYILSQQLADGGFSLSASADSGTAPSGDVDTTAMLMPLLRLFATDDVSLAAYDGAVEFLQRAQNTANDYSSNGNANSNSTAFALSAAVCANSDGTRSGWAGDISGALYKYRLPDGSYSYLLHGNSDELATAQSLIALCDYNNGANLFYTLISESSGNTADTSI